MTSGVAASLPIATSSTSGWMGVHVNIRVEDDRLAALVVVEVRPDEAKEAITIEDGYRKSTKRTSNCRRRVHE